MNKIFALAAIALLITSLPAAAKDTDVVVVGAGLAGLSAALEAARQGAAVTVIDRAAPGDVAALYGAGKPAPVSRRAAAWRHTIGCMRRIGKTCVNCVEVLALPCINRGFGRIAFASVSA